MGQEELQDEILAAQVQRGDKESFGPLMERFEAKLLRYGTKFLSTPEDVEDIVQDVFVSVYQNIQGFDTSQKFSPWIYRIAHNHFVNAIKKNGRNPLTLIDFDILLAHTVHEDPLKAEKDRKEMEDMIDRGLEKISTKYREILILYYLEELSYKDIADVLQVPTGTVGIRVKRAKEALREAYKNLNIQYGA